MKKLVSDAQNKATRQDLLQLIKYILEERGLYERRRTKSQIGCYPSHRERTKSDPLSAKYSKKTDVDSLFANIDHLTEEAPIHLDILDENMTILERWNFNIQL